MEETNQFPIEGLPDDGAMIAELLDDMDTFAGMLERTRAQVAKGKTQVRLVPRGKVYSVEAALDELGDAMLRRTLQVRAQRALRDGEVDAKMGEALGGLETGE